MTFIIVKSWTRRASLASALVSGLGLPISGRADEPSAAATLQTGAEAGTDELASDVIVTAARRSEERRDQGPVAVEVIGRQQIAASGARDAAQVLAMQRGVQLESSFAGVGVMLQGLDPQHTLILIDGERLVGARDGVLDLTRIYASDIQQIEIVRGPASAAYGSDAMAGVVNIVTRPPDAMPSATAEGRYGATRGEPKLLRDVGQQGDAWISATGGSEKQRARLSFGYRHVDSFDLEPTTPATSADGFSAYSVQGRYEWLASESTRVPVQLRAARRTASGIDESAGGAVFDRTQRTDDLALNTAPTFRLSRGGSMRVVGSYALQRAQYLRDQRRDDDGDRYEDAREQQATLRIQGGSDPARAWFVNGGLELFGQHYRSPRISALGLRGRASPYAELQWNFNQQLHAQVAPSIRVDLDTQYGVNVSPRAAFRIDPRPRTSLRAAVGRGFRAPSFTELLLDFQNASANYRVRGNEQLRPENSVGANVALETRPLDELRLSVNAFHNELWDLIDTALVEVVGGEQQYSYVNTRRARTSGVESSLLFAFNELLTLELSHSFTLTRDRERERPLSGRPVQRGSLRAVIGGTPRRWTLSVRCLVVGKRRFYDNEDDTVTRRADAYAALDARAAHRISDWLELFLSAENVADAHGADLLLRPLTIYAGLTVSY